MKHVDGTIALVRIRPMPVVVVLWLCLCVIAYRKEKSLLKIGGTRKTAVSVSLNKVYSTWEVSDSFG